MERVTLRARGFFWLLAFAVTILVHEVFLPRDADSIMDRAGKDGALTSVWKKQQWLYKYALSAEGTQLVGEFHNKFFSEINPGISPHACLAL